MLRLQIFFKVDYLAMRQKKRLTLVRIDELEADVLELPYKNEQISMVVVVPTEDSNVRKLEANLNDFFFFFFFFLPCLSLINLK
jgi:serine protease inhibitor